MTTVWCNACQRSFSSLQYFSKHLFAASNKACLQHYHSNLTAANKLNDGPPSSKRRRMTYNQRREELIKNTEAVIQEEKEKQAGIVDVFEFTDFDSAEETRPRVNFEALSQRILDNKEEENEGGQVGGDDDDSSNEDGERLIPAASTVNAAPATTNRKPNSSQMNQFKAYAEEAHKENGPFSPQMKASVRLMNTVNSKRGSLELYDEISQWHLSHSSTDAGAEHISAKRLHATLIKRYNLEIALPKERKVTLPFCKETISLTTHDARSQTVDLLTDPRITDDCYLFFDDDPLAAPPVSTEILGDINTGLAYRKTYEKLIAPEPYTPDGRRKVLLPYIFYLDGTVVGRMNQNLSIEILKFTLGILNGDTRKKPWAWRNLGHMKSLVQARRKPGDNIRKSGHVDAMKIIPGPNYKPKFGPIDESPIADFDSSIYATAASRKRGREPTCPTYVAEQDFHKMLQVLFASYKDIELDGGIEWDHRQDNKIYKLLYIPFIIFFKVDGKEADKLCGQYTNKNEGVRCLCHACCCPTLSSNNPYLSPSPATKTPQMIIDLVKRKDLDALQKLSQKPIWNALYELRFGLHDNTGIHGACPWEVLHWIQINCFKMTRESFFLQTGETTILSDNIDSLCITIGTLLRRQSDRDLPRTMFKLGVRVGMLQAHHMVGVMIVLALAVRSSQGRHLLLNTCRGDQKQYFNNKQKVREWSYLLETLLMFYSWLGQDELKPHLVERAKVKVKEVLCMIRTVGQRKKGMGDNRSTFHGGIHVPDSILNFGAPKHVNTECNESHHKADKGTAMKTQKRLDTFDHQVGKKIIERLAVELAMVEIETGRCRWHYYRRLDNWGDYDEEDETSCADDQDDHENSFSDDASQTSQNTANQATTIHPPPEKKVLNNKFPVLLGDKTTFFQRKDNLKWVMRTKSRSADKAEFQYERNVLVALEELAVVLKGTSHNDNAASESTTAEEGDDNQHNDVSIELFTMLKVKSHSGRGSQIYYANPMDNGSPWYDWGMFTYNETFRLGQMKAFIDFTELPANNKLKKNPGVYILMEPAYRSAQPNEQRLSEIFEPWVKQPSQLAGMQEAHNHLVLVPLTDLKLPACVVPDLGNSQNKRTYLRMVPRWQWPLMFDDWLEQKHRRQWDG